MNFCDLFEKQAKKNPNDIAVVYEEKFLTYNELEDSSSKLARSLVFNGVTKGDVVGLGIYNGLDLIIGFLGILKSGGIYLPLDPNYPKKKLEDFISDSEAKILIIEKEMEKDFHNYKGKLCFLSDEILSNHSINLPKILSDQIAYIIYTSGSTGKPKGIIVTHAALAHAALAFSEHYSDRPISLLSSSISFDPSILIIVHALFEGGRVCLFNNKRGIDIENYEEVINCINKNSVDFILGTPTFYNNLLDKSYALLSLKNVYLCGEVIHNNLLDKHITIAPNANLYNTYGPSEYAIGSTVSLVYDSMNKRINGMSVGKCFSNNKIYILDSKLRPTPKGIKGEIFVGGSGLALGYLNDQVLTKKQFIFCSHLEDSPIRLFRTGDMGYFSENGDIIFSGRKDFQVKINGHRVELEEIEDQILGFFGVEKAIAVLKDKNIVAFFSTSSTKIKLQDLEKYLKSALPSYMVPALLIEAKIWPMTKNGKIDRNALFRSLN